VSAAFILDASVALTWLFVDERTAPTQELLDRLNQETALIPSWLHIEIANIIALAERRGRVTSFQTASFLSDLARLDLELDVEGPGRAYSHMLPLCRAHGLTCYDAVYLDLALRRQLPLATLDDALRRAAKKLGVNLLGK